MQQQLPEVSVIIPVYNCERYLGEAIESVLAQSFTPFEAIVVDDGSTDHSGEVAGTYGPPVRCLQQAHSGAGAARNLGVETTRAEFLAFLDADDLWPADKLALQMNAFERYPQVQVVSGHVRQFVSPELSKREMSELYCPPDPIPGYVVGAMLIRREAFMWVGLFETGYQVGEVMDWYLRAAEIGLRVHMLRECVYQRRLHKDNKGITHRRFITQRLRILKASLDRRRAEDREGDSTLAELWGSGE